MSQGVVYRRELGERRELDGIEKCIRSFRRSVLGGLVIDPLSDVYEAKL
jgi:hypothetical protein